MLGTKSLKQLGPDGFTLKTRGPRTRDVSIAVEDLAGGSRQENLEVFLVPLNHKGEPKAEGSKARFTFNEVPEGNYQVLVTDAVAGGHFLLEPRTVADSSELRSIGRFPPGAAISGTVKGISGMPQPHVAMSLRDRLAWTTEDGSFEIAGVKLGEHQLQVLGPVQLHKSIRLEQSGQDAGVVYWPDPVREAQFCRRVEITKNPTGRTEWVLEGPSDRFGADINQVYFYTRIVGARKSTHIVHRWINGDNHTDVPLDIKSSDYRTKSSRRVAGRTGEWTVQVLAASGDILMTKSFSVREGEWAD